VPLAARPLGRRVRRDRSHAVTACVLCIAGRSIKRKVQKEEREVTAQTIN